MNKTTFFRILGANPVNIRWSWGAVRDDGTVFLLVWQDEVRRIGEARWVRVTFQAHYVDSGDLGWSERLGHVELIRGGARCYLAIAIAKDTTAVPRSIEDILGDALIEGVELTEIDGDSWVRLGHRIPARELAVPAA